MKRNLKREAPLAHLGLIGNCRGGGDTLTPTSPRGRGSYERLRMTSYYPVYLNLRGRRCVIIGGGTVAEGKIARLLDSGARICVISPDATPGIRKFVADGSVQWEQRKYRDGDLEGAFIAIAATNVREVNRRIFEEANERGVMLNAVDDPPELQLHCAFHRAARPRDSGHIHRRRVPGPGPQAP